MIQKRPDPGDPKKTGSGYNLDMFLMFSKITFFYGIYLPNLNNKHLMTLKIKDKKLFGQNCILYNFI